jgi:hypothetical protein
MVNEYCNYTQIELEDELKKLKKEAAQLHNSQMSIKILRRT